MAPQVTRSVRVPELPLVRLAASRYANDVLEGVAIVGCQHLLATQLTLVDELVSLGLDPANLFLVGKSYSSNAGVYEEFRRRGIYVSPGSLAYDSHVPFDEQFDSAVAAFLSEVEPRLRQIRPRRIVAVDVGGAVLEAWAARLRSLEIPAVGIEQTSSGFSREQRWSSAFPLIDVAHSIGKRSEAPMLAELAAAKLDTYVQRSGLRAPRVLVVGQGPVGAALVTRLRTAYSVVGFDRDARRSDLTGDLETHLSEFDVILGATGSLAVRADTLRSHRGKVHLLSLSSSDREFDASTIRRRAPRSSNPHEHYSCNGVELANGGFPINFDGSDTSLPDESAQLVVALMLTAICQAASAPFEAEVLELDRDAQSALLARLQNGESP
jgi:hypothetical protein